MFFKNRWRDVPPCSEYDIPAMEKWLAQQAARGRELKDWCRFRDAEPRVCQFALEPAEKGQYKPAEEQREAYGDAGWEFACSSSLFLVWRSTRPDAVPLRTDPSADSWAYGRLWKRVRNGTLWDILVLLGVLAFCFQQGGRCFLLNTIRAEATWKFLGVLAAVVVTAVHLLLDLRAFRQLLDSLRCGFPMPSRRLRPRRRALLFCIPLAMILLSFVNLANILTDSGSVPLAEDPVPYIAAEPLGGQGGNVTVERRRDLLGESVLVCQGKPDVVWKQNPQPSNLPGSDILRIVYDTQQETVSLRVAALAEAVLREFTVYIEEEAGERPQPLGEDAYYLLDGNGVQHLALRQGGQVLYLRTNAPADLRDHLDQVAAVLAGFQ